MEGSSTAERAIDYARTEASKAMLEAERKDKKTDEFILKLDLQGWLFPCYVELVFLF